MAEGETGGWTASPGLSTGTITCSTRLARTKPRRGIPVLSAKPRCFTRLGEVAEKGDCYAPETEKDRSILINSQKNKQEKIKFPKGPSSIAIIKHLTHYQPLNGNLLPLALPCHVPTLHSCTHIPLPSVPALLPASPEGLSKLFALSQLLFIGFDTKDKCSYGIPYLGKCHASYIQLSTTMPSALCYLQKADFRGKWTTANQSLLLGKRGEL